MKLVVAVVNREDEEGVSRALAERGLVATKIPSKGGFLDHENTTFFIGVEEERLSEVKALILEKTRPRQLELDGARLDLGGATIFVLDVKEFLKL